MPEKPPLPEEFAPTGPKLSRFSIRPAPPIRPRLFPDEARFVFRLGLLCAGTEFVAWAWLAGLGRRREVLGLAALRLLRPFWAKVGTHLPRPAVAVALVFTALFAIATSGIGVAAFAAGLPAVGDICASCAGDSVTVERRAAAFAWLDMSQALGGVLGLALGAAYGPWPMLGAIPALLIASLGIFALRDRGTTRSSWPAGAYLSALASPIGKQLALTAFACGLLAGPGSALWERAVHGGVHLATPPWVAVLLPLAGMALASRIESRMPNALWLPRAAIIVEAVAVALGWPPLFGVAMGMMFAAIPAAVARGAGEMERPLVSSLAWSALILGAAVGAVI